MNDHPNFADRQKSTRPLRGETETTDDGYDGEYSPLDRMDGLGKPIDSNIRRRGPVPHESEYDRQPMSGGEWILLGVTLAIISLILAVSVSMILWPAHASADANDDAYLDFIHAHGVVFDGGNAAAVGAAQEVCARLYINGGDPLEAAAYTYAVSNMSADGARAVVAAAIVSYCPQFIPPGVTSNSAPAPTPQDTGGSIGGQYEA